MFNKELKERIRLLEYENQILLNKIECILDPNREIIIETDPTIGYDPMSYEELRKKYRTPSVKFDM